MLTISLIIWNVVLNNARLVVELYLINSRLHRWIRIKAFPWFQIIKNKAISNINVHYTFSPPDKLAIFFQLFFGGLTLKTTPSEKGSSESTSSSSASPPRVIICSSNNNHIYSRENVDKYMLFISYECCKQLCEAINKKTNDNKISITCTLEQVKELSILPDTSPSTSVILCWILPWTHLTWNTIELGGHSKRCSG